jgi:hypothetical protein
MRSTCYNMVSAKVAVHYSADTFVVNQSSVLRINPPLRKARKRYKPFAHLLYAEKKSGQQEN